MIDDLLGAIVECFNNINAVHINVYNNNVIVVKAGGDISDSDIFSIDFHDNAVVVSVYNKYCYFSFHVFYSDFDDAYEFVGIVFSRNFMTIRFQLSSY